MIDPAAGSVVAIAEALTNIVFAPLKDGLQSVSLSANWMWPCRNEGEDARLYRAVEACSDFACDLGINIPTGKDSLSMTQKYGDDKVFSPGTVIISAAAEVNNIRKIVSPALAYIKGTYLYYIDFSFDTLRLGGSALSQTLGKIGDEAPTVSDAEYFKNSFAAVQELVNRGLIIAGHDISAGGMVTAMLEMCFANPQGGLHARLDKIRHSDLIKILFAENPGVLIQVKHHHLVEKILNDYGIGFAIVARPVEERRLIIERAGSDRALADRLAGDPRRRKRSGERVLERRRGLLEEAALNEVPSDEIARERRAAVRRRGGPAAERRGREEDVGPSLVVAEQ
ncbi:MAG: hypothetical protein J0I07_34915 [Myxococcales bacterium]|nr:hypothetical protein [Myxococcales bacterium]